MLYKYTVAKKDDIINKGMLSGAQILQTETKN